MATATVRRSVRATKATQKVNLYQRLWLACRLMTLSPDEYARFHKDVYGDPPPAFLGENLAASSVVKRPFPAWPLDSTTAKPTPSSTRSIKSTGNVKSDTQAHLNAKGDEDTL